MTWTATHTWATGDVVSASQMNTFISANTNALVDRIQIVRKLSDETRTSTVTLTSDTALTFNAVAGQDYDFDLTLFTSCATALADLKVGFSFPGAGTFSFGIVGLDPAASTAPIGSANLPAILAATSGISSVAVAAGTDMIVKVAGSFRCLTSGPVTLMWAQNTSNANPVTLRTGSTLKAFRVLI